MHYRGEDTDKHSCVQLPPSELELEPVLEPEPQLELELEAEVELEDKHDSNAQASLPS